MTDVPKMGHKRPTGATIAAPVTGPALTRRDSRTWGRDDPRWDHVRTIPRLDPLRMAVGTRFVVLLKRREWGAAVYVFDGFAQRPGGIVEATFHDERSGTPAAARVDRWRRFILAAPQT